MSQEENQSQIELQDDIESILKDENQEKDCFKYRSQKSDFTGLSQGKWEDQENLKYVMFMEFYQTIFISKQKRKYNKIFKTLSQFLKTRNPSQCRSHFQKLMHRYKTFKKILKFHKNQIGIEEYQRRYQKVVKELERGQESTDNSKQVQECKTYVSDYVQTDQYIPNQASFYPTSIPQQWFYQYQIQPLYNMLMMNDYLSQIQNI